MKLFCADIGTSSIKAGTIDDTGALLSYTRIPFRRIAVGEFLPEYWSAALRRAVAETGASDADGAVFSGQGPTLVPVDRNGEPVSDVLLWNDGRDLPLPGIPSFYLPKAAWFAEHRSDAYARTRSFLPCPEYVSFLLTGERFAFTPSAEFEPYIWNSGSIASCGLDPDRFPPFLTTGEPAGSVTADGERLAGLRRGMPVFAGGADFLAALLGTATVRPGRVCDRAGTSEGINYCSAEPVSGDRIRCLPHAIEGLYNVAGILSSTGRLFEWFRGISGQADRPYAEMLEEIRSVSLHGAGSPLFFPSFHEGVTWEFRHGMFFGLGADHGPAEMGRAVVHSIGFAVREAVEILEHHLGPIEELRVTGGQAKNEIWNGMKADIIGKRIVVPAIQDAELLGDACAGFAGLERFASLRDASESLFRVGAVFEPRPELHERYTEAFRSYRSLYRKLRTAMPAPDLS